MNFETRIHSNLMPWQLGLLTGGGIALAGTWAMVDVEHEADFYRGWLLGFLACWEATIGCLGILMLFHLTGGNWGRAARPSLEAGVSLLPLIALGFLPIAMNTKEIFPWTNSEIMSDPVLSHKAGYLNEQAFQIRAIIYFAVWFLVWFMLVPGRRRSAGGEMSGKLRPRRGAFGLVLLTTTASFAAIDWGMSLEPHWFSAIYGAIFVAGGAVTSMALAVLAVSYIRVSGRVAGMKMRDIRRDLGSLLLAMLMIWTYFVFSQYLIIWSANLPEENIWYLTRAEHGWQILAIVVALLHFVAPFLLLVSQDVREHPSAVSAVALLILAAHALHLLWIIAPAFYTSISDVSWMVLVSFVGWVLLWAAAWLFFLSRRSSDPDYA